MRPLIILLALAAAAPAMAQSPYRALERAREAQASADLQAARNRDVAVTNELSALQARLQADQALGLLQAQRTTPAVPTVVLGPHAAPSAIDTSKLASIPDATLAQSNARIRAAADNRR